MKIAKAMTDKKPFDKKHSTKIPFSELVELISQKCDYNKVFIYEKKIGDQYVYVEEIRRGRNKSLTFQSLRKRKAPD